ncbi:MAG TPA: peptidoglycan recognition family protein, partial [Armatimonadota bacterium]|nr:peptidoglycan recognition family protein [Armatimonadota bacterium]
MVRSRMVIALLVGLVLLAAACCAFADEENSPLTLAREGGDPNVSSPLPMAVELNPVFEAAAKAYDVPVELLLTLGYFGSNFENRGAAPTIEGGYGIMALRDNILGGDSLILGAKLIGSTVDQVKTNVELNIQAAAAVLNAYAQDMNIGQQQSLEAWLNPVIKYAGLDKDYSKTFALEIYQKLQSGLSITNSAGEYFSFAPQDIGAVDMKSLNPPPIRTKSTGKDAELTPMTAQYPPATWYPAASCNYTATSTSKNTVVIHTIEGTAAGCLSWFQNCSAEVSAHYVTSEAGGVWQCVDEWYKAWHVGCANSYCIGIENEGYASSPSHPAS